MMKFQVLALCLMAATVIAMPHASSEEEEEEDSGVMIVGCLAENWLDEETEESNLVRVGTCLKCLEQAGYPLSEEGLPKVKSCISTYMPTINQACAQQIGKVTVGDKESGLAALDCFEDSLEEMGAEWCLKRSTANNIVDKMTEAVSCVLETHKNATDFVKAVRSKVGGDQHEETDGGQEDHQGEQQEKGGKLMQLVLMAHCDVAADGDTSRSDGCKQCFVEALKTDEAQMAANMAACSHSYLLPYYQDCQPGLDSLLHVDPSQSKQKAAEVHQCYTTRLLRHVVSGCVESSTEATVENLSKVMQCGKEHIRQWASQNAGTDLAATLQNFLSNGGDDQV